MIKYRTTLMLIIFCIISFALGALWLQKRAFPYEYFRQLDWLVMFKRNVASPEKSTSIVETTFSDLEIDSFDLGAKAAVRIERGGVHAVGNDLLIVSGRGDLFLYRNNLGEKSAKKLDIETNNNYDQIISFAKNNGFKESELKRYFNYFDVTYLTDPAGHSLILSHLYWHPNNECFTLRLSQLKLTPDEALENVSKAADDWNVLFDSKPCLKLKDRHYLELTGGRVVSLDENTLLLTIGSLDRLGNNAGIANSQKPETDYGKVLKISLPDGGSEVLSLGHRNLQGLAIDQAGNVWVTEHGPKGGDELNLVQPGSNYGWPRVIYGTEYHQKTWPKSKKQGFHEGYTLPMLAWLPSVGTSNLIVVRDFLPEWEGDLLMSTLKQQTLYRMRFREGRIVFSEPIKIGVRIRDIDQLENGKIVLWTDTHVISEITPASSTEPKPSVGDALSNIEESVKPEAARTIKSCQACHSVAPYGTADAAPNLWGVFGSKIASSDFAGYSAALKNKRGVWDAETLDAYLLDTDSFAKGTTMANPEIESPEVREGVINYLQSLK